jgi:acetylglutamate kinase
VTRPTIVKYGGHAMTDPDARAAFAQDVVALHRNGLRPVVVHGGGPQITAHLDRLGIASTFENGLRVTTAETVRVIRMVLVGEVGRDVVGAINAYGPYAVGISGEDAGLLTAEPVDAALGHVGDVTRVDPSAITTLMNDGRIPVVATIATGTDGTLYNVNADTAAAALAVALGAGTAAFLTDVAGLYVDGAVVGQIKAGDLERLLPSLSGGMRPKMAACLRAVRGGVPSAHVLDGRAPHALLHLDAGTTVLP